MRVGVYIHFPFCAARCGYCDFYSTTEAVPHRVYADAVLRELSRRAPDHEGDTLESIYVGGGTPSLWRTEQLARVLAGVSAAFDRQVGEVEVTVEVNPGTVDREQLEGLRAAGVNRISVGVQSMVDATLRMLGRRHTAAEAGQAVRAARRAGFENVGCDLIFGLPGQTVEQHLEAIRRLTDLGPDHVSTYCLTLAASSPLRRAGRRPVDEDRAAEMMEQGREALAALGYPQYEVSNFARPRFRVRHNLGVWACRPYLGLGAGAHSMRWRGRMNLRAHNPELAPYLEGREATVELCDEGRSRFEALFLGLRTVEGVDRRAYRRRFDVDPVREHAEELEALQADGLVERTPDRVRPTRRGIWFADEVALRLLG
jgi:oxygen-independent coproporphyrinogen-3 oxidase